MKHWRKLKSIDFSKRLLIFIELLVIACFILVLIATINGDASALVALITGVFSLASMSFGFYFWKARTENINKYGKNIDKQTIEKIAHYYDSMKEGGYPDE